MGKKIFLIVLLVSLTFNCSLPITWAGERNVKDLPNSLKESSLSTLQQNSRLYQFAKGFLDSQAALLPILKDSFPVGSSVYEDKNGNPFAIVYGVEKDGLIVGSLILNMT
ncbi:MAG: hypothetical protein NUV70_07455 [Caldiserica bacterium]|nr:hypothetical protein [Caldisericota bacterium]